jgi:hypothetical protein
VGRVSGKSCGQRRWGAFIKCEEEHWSLNLTWISHQCNPSFKIYTFAKFSISSCKKEKENNWGVATLALQSSLLTPRSRKVGCQDLKNYWRKGGIKKIKICVKIKIVPIKLEVSFSIVHNVEAKWYL